MLRPALPGRPRRSAIRVRIRGHRGRWSVAGLDRGPAHQLRALLGDPAAVHGGVGLAVPRSQPGPAGQLVGGANRLTSPISAMNTAANTGPIPLICWIIR